MKKVFLLAAVAFATSVNAQVIQIDATALDLTSDAKAVQAGTSLGSNDALDVTISFLDNYKLVDCKGNNFNSIKFDDANEIVTKNGIQGSTNAVDVDGKAPRLSLNAPTQGAAISLAAKKAGVVYVVQKLSCNKAYTVFEDGQAIGFKIAMEVNDPESRFANGVINWECKGEGEFNVLTTPLYDWFVKHILGWKEGDENPTNPGNGLGVVYFPVYEGGKYIFNANGSKASMCGIFFAEAEASKITVADADGNTKDIYPADPTGIAAVAAAKAENARIYNLAGQEVSKNFKGIVIVNGKKYMNK